MKVGIIRCRETENYCPMTTCIKFVNEGKGAFESDGKSELLGVNSCGGCPGKAAPIRAKEMVRRGADTIALASCVVKGTPINFSCPHAQKMKEAIANMLGDNVKILDYSH